MSKKIVLVEIDTCKACPHAYRVCEVWECRVDFFCRHIKKFGEPIPEPDTIPEWCPLEKVK